MRISAQIFCTTLVATLLAATPSVEAASRIYKTIDEDGNVVYTDVAPKEPEEAARSEVILSEPNRFELPDTAVTEEANQTSEQPTEEPEQISYTGLAITAPAAGQAVRSNGGIITLSAAVTPGLAPAHQLRFFMDGRPVGTSSTTSMRLENVDRGEHSAQVVIIDERGQPLFQSNVVTFYLQRISQRQLVNPPPANLPQ